MLRASGQVIYRVSAYGPLRGYSVGVTVFSGVLLYAILQHFLARPVSHPRQSGEPHGILGSVPVHGSRVTRLQQEGPPERWPWPSSPVEWRGNEAVAEPERRAHRSERLSLRHSTIWHRRLPGSRARHV